MNTTQRIIKNIGALVSSNVIMGTSLLILSIFIARYLGDAEFGKYSFALAFTGLFAVLSHLGLDIVVTRDVARDKSQAGKYLGNVFVIKSILSAFTILLIFIVINSMDYPADTRIVVCLAALAMVMSSLTLTCRFIFQAFEKMEYDTITVAGGSVLLLLLGLLLLHYGYGLIEVVCAYALAQIATLLLGIIIVARKFARFKPSIDRGLWKYLLPTTVPFALNGLLLPIYSRIDIVMLSFIKGDAVVGWYNAAFTLVAPLTLLATGFARALFPTISIAFVDQVKLYGTVIQRAIRYSVILLLPIGVGVTLLSDRLIAIIFGSGFTNSSGALQLLIWTGILAFFNFFFITVMEATDKQKKATILLGIGAVANTLLNLLLIPKFSLIGAATATVITQLVCFMVGYYIVGRGLETQLLAKIILRPLAASLLMGAFVFYLQGLNIVLLIFSAAVLYFIVLYLLKGFSKEDWEMLKDMIRMRKIRS